MYNTSQATKGQRRAAVQLVHHCNFEAGGGRSLRRLSMSHQQAGKKGGAKGAGTDSKYGDTKGPKQKAADATAKPAEPADPKSPPKKPKPAEPADPKSPPKKLNTKGSIIEKIASKEPKPKTLTNREDAPGSGYVDAVQGMGMQGMQFLCNTGGQVVKGTVGSLSDPLATLTQLKDALTPTSPQITTSPHPTPAPAEQKELDAVKPTTESLKKMVDDLLGTKTLQGKQMKFKEDEVLGILDDVREILMQEEPVLIRIKAPVKIVGDIHGQFNDLKRLLKSNGYPVDTKYLFLGDYVDRGSHSLETIMLLFCYKLLHPDNLTLLRGNHECRNINVVYGFYDELNRRDLADLYPDFNDVFDHLPFCALIEKKIFCMHGGISGMLKSFNELQLIPRPCSMIPPDAPDVALDLLWADPDKRGKGYKKSMRGVAYTFGMDVLEEFCLRMKIELVVRAHQVVQKGYERMGPGVKTKLVTIFSAPNYCNEFDNSAAVMLIGEKLTINFNVLTADPTTSKEREKERANVPRMDEYPDLDETQKSMSKASLSHKRPTNK